MANIKFSAFTQKVAQADVDFLVGYTGADNVRIAPSTLGDGIYLPLAGGTMTGDLEIIDNIQLQMGNGLDFRLYHDASNSVISSGTGDLYIQNTADDKDIIFKSDDGSGGITTYFYLDGGGTLTRFNEKLRGQDNVQIQVGSAGDFEMVHDGTDTKLNNYTGQLYITNESDDKDIIFRSDNGAGSFTTYFKLDGSSTDIQYFKDLVIADNVKAKFGNSSDLEIYHDASNSYIQDTGTGDLKLLGTNLRLKNGADTITFLEALSGGAVSIYHNGSKRFETTSGGIEITDEVSIGTSLVHTGDTDTKVSFGTDEIVLTTAGTDRVTVKPDGKVGIGISTGLAKELEVEGNIRTRQSGGTTAAEIDITSGATWRFRSNPTSGTNSYGLDIIKGSAGTDIKMAIDTNGNVGIGTAAPDTHLDVVGTDTSISVQDTANANGWAVFRTAASGSPLIGWNENRDFNFGVYNTNTPNTGWVGNRMTITGAGNVGIGTDAPAALLEIAGSGDALRIESTNSGAAGAQIDLLHFTASPADNDVNALINFGGYYTGTTSAYANQIKSVWSDVSDRDAELQFFTNNAGTLTKALTLDTGQNATFAGDIEVENSADGLILESPDGTRYRVTVANGGTLSVAAV